MTFLDDLFSNAIVQGITKLLKLGFDNSREETILSIGKMVKTILPWSKLDSFIWSIFLTVLAATILVYAVLLVFKKGKAVKYRGMINAEAHDRTYGGVLILMGDKLYILSNMLAIALTSLWMKQVALPSIFAPVQNPFAIPFIAIACVFLLLSLLIYALVLVAGLLTIKVWGLVLFLNPVNKTANRMVRLVFINQAFPFALVGIIWFLQISAEIFSVPAVFALAPIVLFIASFALLHVMYSIAWDWDLDVTLGRYRRYGQKGTKMAITAAGLSSAGVGTAAVVAGTAAEAVRPEGQPPIRERRDV